MLLLDLLLNHIGLVLDLVDLLRSAAASLNFRHGAFLSPPPATEATMIYRPSVFAGCSDVKKSVRFGGPPSSLPPRQVRSTLPTATQLTYSSIDFQLKPCKCSDLSIPTKTTPSSAQINNEPSSIPSKRTRNNACIFFFPMVEFFKQMMYVSLNSAAAVRSCARS